MNKLVRGGLLHYTRSNRVGCRRFGMRCRRRMLTRSRNHTERRDPGGTVSRQWPILAIRRTLLLSQRSSDSFDNLSVELARNSRSLKI